jgi:invasion protein IalB
MSTRTETYWVTHSVAGWVVKPGLQGGVHGAFSYREEAIAAVLAQAKGFHPRSIRVRQEEGGWTVECQFPEVLPVAPPPLA